MCLGKRFSWIKVHTEESMRNGVGKAEGGTSCVPISERAGVMDHRCHLWWSWPCLPPILHTQQILQVPLYLKAPYTTPLSLPEFPYSGSELFHLHFLLSNPRQGKHTKYNANNTDTPQSSMSPAQTQSCSESTRNSHCPETEHRGPWAFRDLSLSICDRMLH